MKWLIIIVAFATLSIKARAQSKKPTDSAKARMEWKRQKPEKKAAPDTGIRVLPIYQRETPANPNVPANALPERKPTPNTDLINVAPQGDKSPKK